MSKHQAEQLFLAVKEWVAQHKPSGPESIHQRDVFATASLELAEKCCGIVGYHDPEDEGG